MHTQSYSILHFSEQPSPLSKLPSSQSSYTYIPSPHINKHSLFSKYLPTSQSLHTPF